MEIVSHEMALKIVEMLEKGTAGVTSSMTDLVNEFITFMIFVEAMNASKFLLVVLFAFLVRKAWKLFESSQTKQSAKDFVRGSGIVVNVTILSVGFLMSFNSFISLGKVLLAPKVYLIELAFDKAREFKGVDSKIVDPKVLKP